MAVAKGQAYGVAKQQADSMAAAPIAQGGAWEAPVVPLSAPSARPGEHVMDGVDAGPGRTAAQAGVPGAMGNTTQDGILNTLRGIYEQFPIQGIADLITGFSQNAPWTIDDLFLPSPGDMLDTAKDLANKIPHPTMNPNDLGFAPGGGRAPAPFGDGSGPMFDPNAPLDTSGFQDTRAEGQMRAAAAAGLGAAASQVPTDPGLIPPVEVSAPSDLIRGGRGAQ